MNQQLASVLEKKLGISPEQIVREEYELIILKKLFESDLGNIFIFRGGTALRLAYGSPRFSEDLDFSIIKKFNADKLKSLLQEIANQNQSLSLKQVIQKKNTYFALFKIKEDFLSQNFSIKFKVSTRSEKWNQNKDYQLSTLKSNVTTLTVLAQIASLEKIKREKLSIDPPRIRDVFDLWFINQQLNKPVKANFKTWSPQIVRRELSKFLPRTNRNILNQWLKK